MTQERQNTLDKHLREVVEQLGPLNVATYEFEAKVRDFQAKASDTFATYMLRPYETAKAQLQPLLDRAKVLNQEWEQSRGEDSRRQKIRMEAIEIEKSKESLVIPIYSVASRLHEEDRLVIALAMARHDFARFSCSGGLGYFKKPTDCGNCLEAEKNATSMGIIPFYRQEGDRVYQVDQEELQKILIESITRIPDKSLVDTLLEENSQIQTQRPDVELIKRLNEQKGRLEAYINEREQAIKKAVRGTLLNIGEALSPINDMIRNR